MSKPKGRSIAISPYRQLVCDLMHFSAQVPAVCAERRMNLSDLVQARSKATVRPSYTTIFAKAYGLLSQQYPELRRSYLKFPWPHFYEHPHSIVALNVERRLPEEDVVLFCLVRGPENRTFEEIEAIVRHHREAPIEKLRSYQRGKPHPMAHSATLLVPVAQYVRQASLPQFWHIQPFVSWFARGGASEYPTNSDVCHPLRHA